MTKSTSVILIMIHGPAIDAPITCRSIPDSRR